TTSSSAGTYPITVEVGTLAAANYDFSTLVNGALTITSPGGAIVSVAPSIASPSYGRSLSCTAMVVADPDTGAAPTGTIQFQVDGSNLGPPVDLAGGTATSPSVTAIGAGTHTITAVYSGDGSHLGNTGTVSIIVARGHLTVTADAV